MIAENSLRSRRALLRGGVLASTGLSSAAFVACSPGAAEAPKATGLAPAQLSVQVGGTVETEALLKDRLFPAFAQRHPGVTVEFLPGGMALDKLCTLAAGGTTPELYMQGAAFAPAVANDKLAIPLDDRIKAWGKLGDFFPSSLHASGWQGKQWGLPMMVANRTHLWRKNVLGEAGISKIPSTWDEAVEATRRTTKSEGDRLVREGNTKPDGWTYFIAGLLGVGKTLFRDGKAEMAGQEGIATLEYMLDLNRAIRPPGVPPLTGNDGNKFATGALAHTWTNMTAVRMVAQTAPQDLEQIVVADPPVPSGGRYTMPASARPKPISPNFSDWLAVGALSKAQDQAWQLLMFLTEPENLLAYCETRYFQPPRKSVANQGFMKEPRLQRMVEVFDKHGHAQIRVPDQAIFMPAMQKMGDDVYSGTLSPKQAVEDTARLLQNVIDKTGVKWTTL